MRLCCAQRVQRAQVWPGAVRAHCTGREVERADAPPLHQQRPWEVRPAAAPGRRACLGAWRLGSLPGTCACGGGPFLFLSTSSVLRPGGAAASWQSCWGQQSMQAPAGEGAARCNGGGDRRRQGMRPHPGTASLAPCPSVRSTGLGHALCAPQCMCPPGCGRACSAHLVVPTDNAQRRRARERAAAPVCGHGSLHPGAPRCASAQW